MSTFQATQELAATYAALILADDGIEITVRRFAVEDIWVLMSNMCYSLVGQNHLDYKCRWC